MDKFSAMQAFVRVVEAGNFTKAADSMGLPKPTITRLIQTLEKQLDTKLLNRTTRKVMVTADGAAYYERAGRLLGDVEELESSMSRAKASPRGRLRVDVPSSIGMHIIIPALPDFYARYPDIQLELGVSDRPVDIVAENVDCVVRGGELTDQSLVARRIGEVFIMASASPAYLKRHGVPTHPQQLDEGHNIIRYMSPRTGKLYAFKLHKDGEFVDIGGNNRLSLNDSNAGVVAALAGLGVLFAPSFLMQNHLSTGALEPLFTAWCSPMIPLHVVYPPNRHLSNKVRVFVDWVAELFASHDLIQRKSTLSRNSGNTGNADAAPVAALPAKTSGKAAGKAAKPAEPVSA